MWLFAGMVAVAVVAFGVVENDAGAVVVALVINQVFKFWGLF